MAGGGKGQDKSRFWRARQPNGPNETFQMSSESNEATSEQPILSSPVSGIHDKPDRHPHHEASQQDKVGEPGYQGTPPLVQHQNGRHALNGTRGAAGLTRREAVEMNNCGSRKINNAPAGILDRKSVV